MNTVWRCSVCEAVNQGGRECAACGAVMTRRSAAATAVRGRVAPVPLSSCTLPRTDFTKPAWGSALAGAAGASAGAGAGAGAGEAAGTATGAVEGVWACASAAEPTMARPLKAVTSFFIIRGLSAKRCSAMVANTNAKALHEDTGPIIQAVLAAFYRFSCGLLPNFR